MAAIELRNVNVVYNKGTPLELSVLDNVSLTLERGEFIALVGHNGSGKSTLANIIAGQSFVDSGQIIIDGVDCTKLSSHKRAKFISRVFQDPNKGTAAELTVLENLLFAADRGQQRTLKLANEKNARQQCLKQLEAIGLSDKFDTPVAMLSGGQRQILSMIMAVLRPSKLLLLDEHTSALDPKAAAFVMDFTYRILQQSGITAIMVTHELSETKSCNAIYTIKDRKIVKLEENEQL